MTNRYRKDDLAKIKEKIVKNLFCQKIKVTYLVVNENLNCELLRPHLMGLHEYIKYFKSQL